jgi:hypothetical protein
LQQQWLPLLLHQLHCWHIVWPLLTLLQLRHPGLLLVQELLRGLLLLLLSLPVPQHVQLQPLLHCWWRPPWLMQLLPLLRLALAQQLHVQPQHLLQPLQPPAWLLLLQQQSAWLRLWLQLLLLLLPGGPAQPAQGPEQQLRHFSLLLPLQRLLQLLQLLVQHLQRPWQPLLLPSQRLLRPWPLPLLLLLQQQQMPPLLHQPWQSQPQQPLLPWLLLQHHMLT